MKCSSEALDFQFLRQKRPVDGTCRERSVGISLVVASKDLGVVESKAAHWPRDGKARFCQKREVKVHI